MDMDPDGENILPDPVDKRRLPLPPPKEIPDNKFMSPDDSCAQIDDTDTGPLADSTLEPPVINTVPPTPSTPLPPCKFNVPPMDDGSDDDDDPPEINTEPRLPPSMDTAPAADAENAEPANPPEPAPPRMTTAPPTDEDPAARKTSPAPTTPSPTTPKLSARLPPASTLMSPP